MSIMIKNIISIFFFCSALFGQSMTDSENWEIIYNKNNTKVETSYSDIILKNGEEETLVKWRLTAVKEVDYDKCLRTIMNVDLHKQLFLHCEESRVISENDSTILVYYYYDNPWPAPNMDNIRTTTYNIDSVNNVFVYDQISTPEKYKKQDVDRLELSNIKYRLEKMGNGLTKFEIEEEFLPEGAPIFLVKSFFPEGPLEFLERIIKLSK